MKKLLLILFFIILCNKVFASTPDLTVSSITTSPGSSISIPVTVDLSNPIISNQFNIQYDPSLLTPSSITLGSGTIGWNIFSNSNISGTWTIGMFNTSAISGNNIQIAILNFNVKSGTPSSLISNIVPSKVIFDSSSISNVFDGVVTLALPGDVNSDGTVSILDAQLVAQYSIGLSILTPSQLSQADVSGDGTVTIYDAALIAQYASGVITKFK